MPQEEFLSAKNNEELNLFFNESSTTKRKYLFEAGLNLFTPGPVMFRPSDIYRFSNHPVFRSALEGTNIYVVGKRRRISICPRSIELKNGELYGNFMVHGDTYFEWEREPFSPDRNREPSLRFVAARAADSFGHALDVIDEKGRRGLIPSATILASTNHRIGDRGKLEVVYVGQTFGKHGERISIDRLRRHSTFQRVMADCSDESGINEIIILAFHYDSTKNFLSTAGNRWVEPSATAEEEKTHMSDVGNLVFDRKTRILLAEAALINYFKPHYNELHRNSFHPENNKKLRTLKKLFESDMSALIVEINTSNIRSKLWSKNAPHCTMKNYFNEEQTAKMRANALSGDSQLTVAQVDEWLNDQTHAHIARFNLYDKTERESFLHGLPWNELNFNSAQAA